MKRWLLLLAVVLIGLIAVVLTLYFLTPKFYASALSGTSPLTVTFTTTEGISTSGSMNPTWVDFGDGSPVQHLICRYQILPYTCWPPIKIEHTYSKPGVYSVQVLQGTRDTVVLHGIDITVK